MTFAHLKLLPGERLPHSAGDGAEQTHAHQEEHNLKGEILKLINLILVAAGLKGNCPLFVMLLEMVTMLTHPEDDEVEQPVDAGPLELCLSRVLHEFGVLAGEDDDAVGPLRVAEHGA